MNELVVILDILEIKGERKCIHCTYFMDKITDIWKINYSGLHGLLVHEMRLDSNTKTNIFSRRNIFNTWSVLKFQHHQKWIVKQE